MEVIERDENTNQVQVKIWGRGYLIFWVPHRNLKRLEGETIRSLMLKIFSLIPSLFASQHDRHCH